MYAEVQKIKANKNARLPELKHFLDKAQNLSCVNLSAFDSHSILDAFSPFNVLKIINNTHYYSDFVRSIY